MRMATFLFWRIVKRFMITWRLESNHVKVIFFVLFFSSSVSKFLLNLLLTESSTNCRVYGVKIFTQSEGDENLLSEIFLEKKLHLTYPRLSNFPATFLFRRAEILIRFIKLFDLCMDAILPAWTYDNYFQGLIKSVKKILILSSRRIGLLERILSSIPTNTSCAIPLIYIDRPLAFAYRGKLALDPNYQNTIFMQIFNSLSPSYNLR